MSDRYDELVLKGTTDASGDAVVDSNRPVTGYVEFVDVDGAALTDSANLVLQPILYELADGAVELGESIINNADIGNAAQDKFYPRKFVQDNAGADLAVATGQKVAVGYFVPGAKLRATVSAGGNTKAFRIRVFVR